MDSNFSWSSKMNTKQLQNDQRNVLKSLIDYSIEIEKVGKYYKTNDINTLEQLFQPDFLIQEFKKKNSISSTTMKMYESFLRANLLLDLYNSVSEDKYQFCNTQKLFIFMNQFANKDISIGDYWLKTVSNFNSKYQSDFCITIPTFMPADIVSLLINPLTKRKGPIFNQIPIQSHLIDEFYIIRENVLINPQKV